MPYGAFVEILPGKDGLLHISEIANRRLDKVEDELKAGDTVKVQIINVDNQGKLKLSRKRLLPDYDPSKERDGGGGGGGPRSGGGGRGRR